MHFKKPEKDSELVPTLREAIFLIIGAAALGSPANAAQFLPRAYSHLERISTALKGQNDKSPEALAWRWLSLTLTTATAQFLNVLRNHTPLNAHGQKEAIDAFIESSLDLATGAAFESATLLHTSTHPAFSSARRALPTLINAITNLTKYDLALMQAEFGRCLNAASTHVFASYFNDLSPLVSSVAGPVGEASKRDIAWARHGEWIQRRFQSEPVFSPDGSIATPLSELYLRLRCIWHERTNSDQSTEEYPQKTYWKASVGDLHSTLRGWLDNESNTFIKIVAGGPGCGKSSFAKAFCCEIVDAGVYRVIFFELQRMPFTGDIYSDIGNYLFQRHKPSGNEGSPGFEGNPLDWIKGDNRPTLFVFDGLDELTHDQALAQEISRKFVLNVHQLADRLNADGTRVRAVVLGRSAACKEGLKDASLPISAMLNVAPIRALREADLRPHEQAVPADLDARTEYPVLDDDLCGDQRPLYWERWTKTQNIPTFPLPQAITHGGLSDLNVEPLLLHLLILSDFCGDKWEEAAANRNLVYEDILKKVHRRNTDKRLGFPMGTEDFFLLMECLGLAAWRGNARGGSEAAYESVREVHALHRKTPLNDFKHADLRSVVLQTHARPLEGASPGFEFIHKSFGEYLAARGLLSLGLRSAYRLSREDDPAAEEQIAEDWVKIVGEAEITFEVYRFIHEEADRRLDDFKPPKILRGLENLLNWVNKLGMPVQKVGAPSFRKLETMQRCAERALITVCTAIASTLQYDEKERDVPMVSKLNINWNDNPPEAMFSRLRIHSHPIMHSFKAIKFDEANLAGLALRSLDLAGTSFVSAVLSEANLSDCSLASANFSKAYLEDSDLSNIYAHGVSFSGATLNRADLSHAYLPSANLSDTALLYADLTEAVLSHADFSGAILEGAILRNCSARFTRFHVASGLTQEQVDSAFGVRQGFGLTTLPDWISYPDHWHSEVDAEEDSVDLRERFELAYEGWKQTLLAVE